MSVVGGQPKKHASTSYKATKHMEHNFRPHGMNSGRQKGEISHMRSINSCDGIFLYENL